VVTKIVRPRGEQLHIFHLGIDTDGVPTNASDFDPPIRIEEKQAVILDQFMQEPQEETRGWGLVLLKRKGQ